MEQLVVHFSHVRHVDFDVQLLELCPDKKTLNFFLTREITSFFIKDSVQVQIKKYIKTYTELMNDN